MPQKENLTPQCSWLMSPASMSLVSLANYGVLVKKGANPVMCGTRLMHAEGQTRKET